MKTLAIVALVLVATPVVAQTPSTPATQTRPTTTAPARAGDLTRMLNGAPPATVTPPAASRPTAPTPGRAPATAPTGRIERPTSAITTSGPAIVPRPTGATTPSATSATPPVTATPAVSPAPAATVLNPAAIAALPFSIELPTGFQLTTGRPGPDFKVYTIRKGTQPFVMIYAGPSSQFPIYDGEMAVAGGRTSVVVSEGTQRRAMEHLFTSTTAPREIHVWVSSLDGADRAVGERIAQSVDAR